MDFDKVIEKRQSVRSFKLTKKPDWRDIIEAIEAANQAPLAGNMSCLRFIFVDDAEKIKELAEASQQSFVGEVSYIVVVCSDNKNLEKAYDERGLKYAREEAGAGIENFLLKITDLGLASCWVGAFVDTQVRQILNIPDNIEVVALLPVGYGKSLKKRRKPDLSHVLFFNKWKQKWMKPVKKPGY